MPNLHRLYKAQQATIVHAAATPYRERSHFDGQDVLESGLARPGAVDTGWLNRALLALASGGRVDPRGGRAVAVGPVTPLVVRGRGARACLGRRSSCCRRATIRRRACSTSTATPTRSSPARSKSRMRLAALGRAGDMDAARPAAAQLPPPGIARAARLLRGGRRHGRALSGPRRTARASAPWASSAGIRTSTRAPRRASSPACSARSTARWRQSRPTWASPGARRWSPSITEFGRTARINGTDGTDHGTGTVALLAGGALKGGRVIADWPGLKPANLHEGRDLKPTTDLRAVLKGLLRDHLRVEESALASSGFPGQR